MTVEDFKKATDEHNAKLRAELLGYYRKDLAASNELPKVPDEVNKDFLSYAAMQVRYGALATVSFVHEWMKTCKQNPKLRVLQSDRDNLQGAERLQVRMDYIIKHLGLDTKLTPPQIDAVKSCDPKCRLAA